MTPYHIKAARLNVPMKFARSNGLTTRRMLTHVILVDEAKSTWPATLQIKTDQIRIAGWRNLIIANDLRVGDTCMFELVKSGEVPVFTFYKLEKKPTNNNIQVKKETISAKQIKATSSTRYFTSTLNPYSCERSILYLPAEFSISNGLRTGEMILRDDKGRSWKVQLNKLGENRFYFGCGFRDFLVANGLREGDTYKFEIVENEKDKPPVMNFSYLGKLAVKKHIHLLETSSTIKKLIGPTVVKKKGMPQIMKEDVDSTPSEIEGHPYYNSEVKASYMSMLYLPSKFARKNGLFNKEEMILKDDNERSWTMVIKVSGGCCYIGRGWNEFCAANGLKEGDLFKLELVSNGEIPVANVYVQKAH
ncbi:B3 domain-containing protein REM10-like [Bidens hawaiensis]|uniref:B3 domain-containing protein REM10-like n=1 Tax=Bidens hawaiensis TaxID=980011 RepID=UPI004049438A